MKMYLLAALAGSMAVIGCATEPVQRVAVPGPEEPSAYRPVPMQKPLPPNGAPGPALYAQPPAMGGGGGVPMPLPGQGSVAPNPSIQNEDAFLAAYVAQRSPRIMVFVNRTIQGDPLPKDGLTELIRVEDKQSATGAVNVAGSKTVTGSGQSTAAGIYGSSASNTNINKTDSSSFSSGGPADYTHTTSVKMPADKYDVFGATADDYGMIELSLTKFFDNSGKVRVQDSEAARGKLNREQVLRIENGDPAANRLLSVELQQDVLIRVTGVPTNQARTGAAVRLMAKAVSTTDARVLGTAFQDMQLPMSKTNITYATRYLAEQLMADMARKWSLPPEYSPIEVRVYKAATVDDAVKIRSWLKQTKGVTAVNTNSATGASATAYASFAVGYAGAPEDLYADLKAGIGFSQGLKADDLTNNTITLEVTGAMNLVTTTRREETKTTTETRTIEERKVEPINPAPTVPPAIPPALPPQ